MTNSKRNRDFNAAESCFKIAFQHYYESGNERANLMLKYNTIANILSGMNINPFDSPETSIFSEDPKLGPYMRLWEAYFAKKHEVFLDLVSGECDLEDDPLTRSAIPDLQRAIIKEFIKEIFGAYTSLSLEYLSQELRIDKNYLVSILSEMINSGIISGYIDELEWILDNDDSTQDRIDHQDALSIQRILLSFEKVV